MNLRQHPEYEKYLVDQALINTVKVDLTSWLADNEEAGVLLKTAVLQLIILFQEYNREMWKNFPFCKMCLGGCCVVGASEISPMDAAALTVLGHDLPILPEQTHHNERACIYLGEQGCTWPANWRPLKCMVFFSLGSGDWSLDSLDKRYGRLTDVLQAVFDKYLPSILGKNNETNTQSLADPILFAPLLSRLLANKFLPESISGDNGRFPAIPLDSTATALLAIALMTEQILTNPPAIADQLLADLEQFEWVVNGHPSQENRILIEINSHNSASQLPISLQFDEHIQQYRQSIHINNSEDL